MPCTPGPWFDPVMKCWRMLDCVSKNRVHVVCDSRNAPVATVKDLMGADLSQARLPSGWGSRGVLLDGADSTIPGQYAYGDEAPFGFNGFGHFGGFGVVSVGYAAPNYRSVHADVVANQGRRCDSLSPVESMSVPCIGGTTVLDVTNITNITVQPNQPTHEPVAVNEPAMVGIWAALLVCVYILHRDNLRKIKEDTHV